MKISWTLAMEYFTRMEDEVSVEEMGLIAFIVSWPSEKEDGMSVISYAAIYQALKEFGDFTDEEMSELLNDALDKLRDFYIEFDTENGTFGMHFFATIYNDHQKGIVTLRLNPDLRTLDLTGEALGVGEKDI